MSYHWEAPRQQLMPLLKGMFVIAIVVTVFLGLASLASVVWAVGLFAARQASVMEIVTVIVCPMLFVIFFGIARDIARMTFEVSVDETTLAYRTLTRRRRIALEKAATLRLRALRPLWHGMSPYPKGFAILILEAGGLGAWTTRIPVSLPKAEQAAFTDALRAAYPGLVVEPDSEA